MKTEADSQSSSATMPNRVRMLQGIALLLVLLIVGSMLSRYRAAAIAKQDSAICYGHLKEISAALLKYRSEHNGRVPRALVPEQFIGEADTLYPRYIKSMDVLRCPTAIRNEMSQGRTLREDQRAYPYEVQFWVRNLPGDILSSKEFYEKIVPQRGSHIRLVTCGAHLRGWPMKVWAVMWDGSIQEKDFLFDTSFGRYKRHPAMRAVSKQIRKRGGLLPPDE